MPYFTPDETVALKNVLQTIIDKDSSKLSSQDILSYTIGQIKKHDLIQACDKSAYIELLKDDVTLVTNNDGMNLSQSEIEDIAHNVAGKFNSEEQSEYIRYMAESITKK